MTAVRTVASVCAAVSLMCGAAGERTLSAAQAPAAPAQAPAARGPAAPTPATCGPNASPAPELKNVAKDSRCFEIRTYVVQPEGPGNPDLLHRRFREHTLGFFKKHGIGVVGFWQPVNKPDTIVYLLVYKDAAARDAAWAAFGADPGWQKARAELNVRLQVTSEFVVATDYSPMK